MVHFIGFKGDEYARAQRVFGPPDFVHRLYDARVKHGGEVAPGDTLIFANGEEQRTRAHTYNDSQHF